MKILIDMNLSPLWVDAISRAGFDAMHWSEVGKANATDREIMAFAISGDYVVLTHDLDFGGILAATHGQKPSVVQIRAEDLSFDAIGKPVVAALTQMRTQLEAGALLTIDVGRNRLRLLPLHTEN